MSEINVHLEQMMPMIREQLADGKQVRFTPHGTSMLPMLLGGRDQVVLSPLTGKLRKYDLPLYRRDNGQYVMHRVLKTGDTYTCIGDNQFAYEPGVREDQLIAQVSEFTRKGKTYSVKSSSYRLYCVLWHYTRWPRRIYRGIKWRLLAVLHKD